MRKPGKTRPPGLKAGWRTPAFKAAPISTEFDSPELAAFANAWASDRMSSAELLSALQPIAINYGTKRQVYLARVLTKIERDKLEATRRLPRPEFVPQPFFRPFTRAHPEEEARFREAVARVLKDGGPPLKKLRRELLKKYLQGRLPPAETRILRETGLLLVNADEQSPFDEEQERLASLHDARERELAELYKLARQNPGEAKFVVPKKGSKGDQSNGADQFLARECALLLVRITGSRNLASFCGWERAHKDGPVGRYQSPLERFISGLLAAIDPARTERPKRRMLDIALRPLYDNGTLLKGKSAPKI